MTSKKNILSYIIIITYILLNAAMIFGRLYYYNPASNYDICKACVITGIPVLILIILILIKVIIKALWNRRDMVSTQDIGQSVSKVNIICTSVLFFIGIAARLFFIIFSPGGYISVISKNNSLNPGDLYSDLIELTAFITGDNNSSVMYLNLVLSIVLMALIHSFSKKAISQTGASIVLLLAAISPYELIRCLTYSPELLYSILIFALLNIYIYCYEKYKLNYQNNIRYTFFMILLGVLSGIFLVISPIAIPLIISLFIFTRLKTKDIFQSIIYLLFSVIVYWGLTYFDMYIVSVDFIHNLHKTADIFNNNMSMNNNHWNNFTLLCSENPMYNNYIIDTYVYDCIWMFLNIFSIAGALYMLKRNRSYNQLLMQITIITIPLCLLLYNYSESLNMYYIVYSLLVCIAGGTIYNIFTDIEQDNDDIVTTTLSEVKPTTETVPEPVTDTEPESTVETVSEPVTDTEPDSTTEAVPYLTADTYSDIEHNTGIIDDDDNPEPLKISDILPEISATNETGNCGMGDNNTDNDIYNMLPVPRPIVPYGLSEKSIIIRDYQNNTNKESFNAEQWEARKRRAQKKKEIR